MNSSHRSVSLALILGAAALQLACGNTHAGTAGKSGQGDPNTSPTSNPSNPTTTSDGGQVSSADAGSGILHVACDDAIPARDGGPLPEDFAQAMGMCDGLVSAKFVVGDPSARSVRQGFGTKFVPQEGQRFVLFSSGKAVDNVEEPDYSPGDVSPDIFAPTPEGTQFYTDSANPYWTRPPCGCSLFGCLSAPSARDMTDFQVQLKVPDRASCLSFDFSFFSAEYPEWVCKQYDDRFVVGLKTSANPKGENISFDSTGNPVTVNNDFFQLCESTTGHVCTTAVDPTNVGLLEKTGYDRVAQDRLIGGSTGWLTTTAPVTPGDTITLDFYVFDEGDYILDTAALVDNFHWLDTCPGAPTTTPDQDAGIPLE